MRIFNLKTPVPVLLLAFLLAAATVFGSPFASTAAAASSDGFVNVKVMSYNIAAGQGAPNNSTDYVGTKYLDLLVKLLKAEKFDIAGMQEVDDNRFTTRTVNEAKYLAERLGLFYYWHEASSVGPFGLINKHGNSVTTKFKILKKECIQYKSKGKKSDGGASAETRAFTVTLLDVNGTKINFISTHLGFPEYARIGQAKELVEYIAKLKEPVIVVGDFNTSRGKPDYNIIAAKLTDAYTVAREKGAMLTCGKPPKSCIDFVFFTPGFFQCDRAFSGGENYKDASDHRPVFAFLKFSKAGAMAKAATARRAASDDAAPAGTAGISAEKGEPAEGPATGDKKLIEIKQSLFEKKIE